MITPKEMQQRATKKRWEGKTADAKAKIMREVALKRWGAKVKKKAAEK